MEIHSAKFVTSTKGKRLIAIGEFLFRKQSVSKGRSYWCCHSRQTKCKARLHVKEDTDPPLVYSSAGEHNHDPVYGLVEAKIAINSMKKQAMETDASPSEIYAKAMAHDRPPLGAMTNGHKQDHVERCLSVIRRAKKRRALKKMSESMPLDPDWPSMVMQNSTGPPAKRFKELKIPIASEFFSDPEAVPSAGGIETPTTSLQQPLESVASPPVSPEPAPVNDANCNIGATHCCNLMTTMYALQIERKFCDFTVTLLPSAYNGLEHRKAFSMHKVVLAAASQRICSLEKSDIKIGGKVTSLGIEKVIEFAYTGQIADIDTLSNDECTQVNTAASALDIAIKDYLQRCKHENALSDATLASGRSDSTPHDLNMAQLYSAVNAERQLGMEKSNQVSAVVQVIPERAIKNEAFEEHNLAEVDFSLVEVPGVHLSRDGLAESGHQSPAIKFENNTDVSSDANRDVCSEMGCEIFNVEESPMEFYPSGGGECDTCPAVDIISQAGLQVPESAQTYSHCSSDHPVL